MLFKTEIHWAFHLHFEDNVLFILFIRQNNKLYISMLC
jgi:hypothetical protein